MLQFAAHYKSTETGQDLDEWRWTVPQKRINIYTPVNNKR